MKIGLSWLLQDSSLLSSEKRIQSIALPSPLLGAQCNPVTVQECTSGAISIWIEIEVRERGDRGETAPLCSKAESSAKSRSFHRFSLPSLIHALFANVVGRPIHPMHSQSHSRRRFIAVVARLSCLTSISDKSRMAIVKEASRQNEWSGSWGTKKENLKKYVSLI